MILTTRRAAAEDVPLLVDIYHRAYHGGYSALLDRYGPISPADFWWVQSEKEIYLLEVNREAKGMAILGRRDGSLLVEEVLGPGLPVDEAGTDAGPGPTPSGRFLQRLGASLLQHFRRHRQERFLLRASEGNALGLALVRHLGLTFANTLIVATLRPRGRQTARLPEGYAIRRATPVDAASLVEGYRDTWPSPPETDEVARLLRRPEVRAAVAERGGYMVGFLLAQARDGAFGDLAVGIREGHRRRGIGRALATPALNFFAARQLPVLGLHWGLDGTAHAFYRALGFVTERIYLFFEKSL